MAVLTDSAAASFFLVLGLVTILVCQWCVKWQKQRVHRAQPHLELLKLVKGLGHREQTGAGPGPRVLHCILG